MKVLTSPASPFGRKVKMTAMIKGLTDQIEFINGAATDPGNENPLGKIPVLTTADGTAIYDSPVICEYLDAQVALPVMFPGEGANRWRVLTLGALGDGIIDAAILLVYESRYRPAEMRVDAWVEMQQAKIDKSLAYLEASPPERGETPDYGTLTIAIALAYLDFRHEGKWRAKHPKMVAWLEDYENSVPGFKETAPPASA